MDQGRILKTLEDLRDQHASTIQQLSSRQPAKDPQPAAHGATAEPPLLPGERQERIRTMLSSLSPSRVTAGMRTGGGGGVTKILAGAPGRPSPAVKERARGRSDAQPRGLSYPDEEAGGASSFMQTPEPAMRTSAPGPHPDPDPAEAFRSQRNSLQGQDDANEAEVGDDHRSGYDRQGVSPAQIGGGGMAGPARSPAPMAAEFR